MESKETELPALFFKTYFEKSSEAFTSLLCKDYISAAIKFKDHLSKRLSDSEKQPAKSTQLQHKILDIYEKIDLENFEFQDMTSWEVQLVENKFMADQNLILREAIDDARKRFKEGKLKEIYSNSKEKLKKSDGIKQSRAIIQKLIEDHSSEITGEFNRWKVNQTELFERKYKKNLVGQLTEDGTFKRGRW